MLQKLRDKIHGTELEDRITLHKCEVDKIGVLENFEEMVKKAKDTGFILIERPKVLFSKAVIFKKS